MPSVPQTNNYEMITLLVSQDSETFLWFVHVRQGKTQLLFEQGFQTHDSAHDRGHRYIIEELGGTFAPGYRE
jgi:hypothetical protein